MYVFPMLTYYFIFFFSVVYLSAKIQRKCTDVGLKFFCVENRYKNGSIFEERKEKINFEHCIAKYSNESTLSIQIPITLYYCIFLSTIALFLFISMWYISICKIQRIL